HSQTSDSILPGQQPKDTTPAVKQWIGEYGPDGPMLTTVAENAGVLMVDGQGLGNCTVAWADTDKLPAKCSLQQGVSLESNAPGVPSRRTSSGILARRELGVDAAPAARIHPVRPVAELRGEALQA